MYRKYLLVFFTSVLLIACGSDNSVDVSHIEVDSKLVRFDSLFYKTNNIAELKAKYPKMFPEHVNDSVWLNKQSDIEDLRILAVSDSVHGDFSVQYSELIDLFKHF